MEIKSKKYKKYTSEFIKKSLRKLNNPKWTKIYFGKEIYNIIKRYELSKKLHDFYN